MSENNGSSPGLTDDFFRAAEAGRRAVAIAVAIGKLDPGEIQAMRNTEEMLLRQQQTGAAFAHAYLDHFGALPDE